MPQQSHPSRLDTCDDTWFVRRPGETVWMAERRKQDEAKARAEARALADQLIESEERERRAEETKAKARRDAVQARKQQQAAQAHVARAERARMEQECAAKRAAAKEAHAAEQRRVAKARREAQSREAEERFRSALARKQEAEGCGTESKVAEFDNATAKIKEPQEERVRAAQADLVARLARLPLSLPPPTPVNNQEMNVVDGVPPGLGIGSGHVKALGGRGGAASAPAQDAWCDYDGATECVICFDAHRTQVALGCFHLALCERCSRSTTICPICNAPTAFRRVFWS